MNKPSRGWHLFLMVPLLFSGSAVLAQNEDEWGPTPPRVSYLEGDVSYWRTGAEDWAVASVNLPLAEGDALYTGRDSNFEVQFGSRSFVRADESSELMLVSQDERRIHFNVTTGLVSFDMRRIPAGTSVEMSTPNAVFLIDDPGYYRVDVGDRETHFITRHGGQATVTTADGRTLSIYPSEDIVITAGKPVRVATYAAPQPDAWDRWNDERTDRIGESISARYLSPDIYGAEELDHYGRWRVVDTYGAVWIPDGVGDAWVPYSTGYWVWDPYYEWTWVDGAPWGWAPFHYGRWVYIDGYWAWVPGPIVQRAVYAPALVAFITPGPHVSVSVTAGLPALWWVALWWGEPVVPWWHHHRYHGHPRWDGWGGPRIVNGRDIRQTPFTNVAEIRYHNATLPRAVLTESSDKFGRGRITAPVETRLRSSDFVPVSGELPVTPSSATLYGGAPKGIQPPREILSHHVVSKERPPQPPVQPWQKQPSRTAPQKLPEVIYMTPPSRSSEERRPLQRPPFGSDGGPELTPPPRPPRYDEMRRSMPQGSRPSISTPSGSVPQVNVPSMPSGSLRLPATRSQPMPGGQPMGGREGFSRPPMVPQPQGSGMRPIQPQQPPLPGRPANQPHQRPMGDSRSVR